MGTGDACFTEFVMKSRRKVFPVCESYASILLFNTPRPAIHQNQIHYVLVVITGWIDVAITCVRQVIWRL